MNKGYMEIRNKYLAQGLAFFGFRYYKFTNSNTGKTSYSFKNTDKLENMINKMLEMKKSI